MTSANVIVATAVYLGCLWVLANYRAARREFRDLHKIKIWVSLSALVYLTLASMCLLFGASGVLARFDQFPPPILGFFIFMIASSFFLAFSKFGSLVGKHLTLSELIGFQSFRILAELALMLGLREGRTPIQLTLEGYNFDIFTGISALFVAYFLRSKQNLSLAFTWNTMGLCCLIVILFIANTSFPTPLRIFMNEPSNIWVTHLPYTLLPGILVVFGLAGHLLTYRKLKRMTQKERSYEKEKN